MGIRITYVTSLIGAATAAAAIALAPVAAAASGPSQPDCSPSGSGSVCQSPGNVQINDAPPAVNFFPYGGETAVL